MNRHLLIGYQLMTGFSDTATGLLLLLAPDLTLRLMHLSAPRDALIYISYIGAFVLSVGLSCLYGALLAYHGNACTKLQTVWLLTALTRASVATFVTAQVLVNTLEAGWMIVAAADGACVIIQAIGLRRGWLARASS